MSLKVLVIPEDPTYNGAILKPLVEALMTDIGKPAAKITVLSNPRLGGYDHAVKAIRAELPDRYGFFDLWLFMPDGDRANPAAMQGLEQETQAKGIKLLCCAAQPEVEIYACAAYRSEIKMTWATARAHPKMKEAVFEPLVARVGDARRASGGRDKMIAESLKNLALLYQLCPELQVLRDRLAALLADS